MLKQSLASGGQRCLLCCLQLEKEQSTEQQRHGQHGHQQRLE
jgi:hypothetical protein